MKKTFFTLVLIACSVIGNSQSLTLDEMISLYNKDLDETTDYLISKNWQFSHAQYDSLFNGNIAVFAYSKNYNTAATWFYKGTTHVRYQTSNKTDFETIKAKIKGYHMQLVDSKLTENGIESFYQGKNYEVLLLVSTIGELDKAVYIVYLVKK